MKSELCWKPRVHGQSHITFSEHLLPMGMTGFSHTRCDPLTGSPGEDAWTLPQLPRDAESGIVRWIDSVCSCMALESAKDKNRRRHLFQGHWDPTSSTLEFMGHHHPIKTEACTHVLMYVHWFQWLQTAFLSSLRHRRTIRSGWMCLRTVRLYPDLQNYLHLISDGLNDHNETV